MWLAVLALFVVTLGFGIVVPIMPAIAGGMSAHAAQYSALFVAYSAARIGFQIPGGVWVDRVGAGRVLRVSLLAYAVSLAALAVPGRPVWFTAARAIEGAATGLAYPAVLALAAAGPPEGMGRRIGIAVGVGSSGFLLGPVVGGALVGLGTFVPIAVGASAALVLFACASAAAPAAAPAPPEPRSLRGEVDALRRLVTRREFVGLMLPLSFNKLTFSGFQALLPLWGADRLGLGVRGVTALFALAGIIFSLVQPLAGALADRVRPRVLIIACGVPLLAVLALLGRADDGWTFGAGFGAYVLLTSAIFTATTREAGQRHGESGLGGVFGVLNTGTDLMTVIGPSLFLALYALDRTSLFPAVAAFGVAFHLGFIALGRRPAG